MPEPLTANKTPGALPLIPQLFNTCGLATVLMLTATPPGNGTGNRQFLTRVLEAIVPILPKDVGKINPEIALQYVLQYLLLKVENQYSTHYQFLFNYLHGKFGYLFDDQVAIHAHLMKNKMEHFNQTQNYPVIDAYRIYLEKGGLITPELIRNEMFTMKSDVELKFLMEIFGYQFISNESGDGTGALFVSEKRRKKEMEKVHLIINEVIFKPHYRVLYGIYNHWVTLTGISQSDKNSLHLTYNDPIGPETKSIELDSIDNTHRFYIFKWQFADLEPLWENIGRAIVADIKIEQNLQKAEAIKRVIASKEEVDEDFFKGVQSQGKISMGEFREEEPLKRMLKESFPKNLQTEGQNPGKTESVGGPESDPMGGLNAQVPSESALGSLKARKPRSAEWDTDIDFDFDESS